MSLMQLLFLPVIEEFNMEKKIVIIKLYNVNTFTIQNIMSAFVGMTIYPSNTQPKKLIQIWLQNLVGFIWLHHL